MTWFARFICAMRGHNYRYRIEEMENGVTRMAFRCTRCNKRSSFETDKEVAS